MRQTLQNLARSLAVVVTAALTTPLATAATYTSTVRATSGTSGLVGPTDSFTRVGTHGWMLVGDSTITEQVGDNALGRGQSQALSYVLPGGLQLLAQATGMSTTSSGQMAGGATAIASGSSDDTFTVLVPGCSNLALCGAGRRGEISFAIAVEGVYGGSGSFALDGPVGPAGWSVSGGWSADVRVNAGYIPGFNDPTSMVYVSGQSRSQTSTSQPVITGNGSFAVRNYSIGFLFGQPISVHLAGSVNASSNTSAFVGSQSHDYTATAVADFKTDLMHTIAWGGVTEIRDATGALVNGYTAFSAGSGFDYGQAYVASVPEPAPWALAACGGLMLAWLSRRRRPG